MSPSASMMSQAWIQCFGWVVFHFLWQACIAAGALWLALRLLRHATPRSRYACGWLGLLLCTALPLITALRFIWGIDPGDGHVQTLEIMRPWCVWGPVTLRLMDGFIPVVGLKLDEGQTRLAAWVFSTLAVLWLAGSAVLLTRFRRGWSVMVNGIRSASEAPASVCNMLAGTSRAMDMAKPPKCRMSATLNSPVVMGVFSPAVVVPAGFESDFTSAQQRMLLAHELAHIMRGDPWRNSVQCVLETLMFWHPAALWISRCIRHEREMCCDEFAVAHLGHSRDLAHALANLAEAGAGAPCLQLCANRGSLLERVRMLVAADFPLPLLRARVAFAFLTMPLALLAAFYAHVASGPMRLIGFTRLQPSAVHPVRLKLPPPDR